MLKKSEKTAKPVIKKWKFQIVGNKFPYRKNPIVEKKPEPEIELVAEKKKTIKILKETVDDDGFWTDELVEDRDDEEDVDMKKLKFIDIKEIKVGMTGINITASVDFIGTVMGKEYGDEPFAIGFVKDSTGEIRLTFWGDDIKKAKRGKKIRVINANAIEYKGQLQLQPDRRRGIEFI